MNQMLKLEQKLNQTSKTNKVYVEGYQTREVVSN